ncbi:MAG: FRG domain-containing protein [Betaproteobacteria bacterium]|nr:FRG domain-containing protein [Betaproteobacteria bacterium]
MAERNWKASNDSKGYGEVHLSSWDDFSAFVHEEMREFDEYVWRGQRCENWDLASTLDRLIKNAKIAKTKQYGFIHSHLERFKYAARGRRGQNPRIIESENEWWALGQHHGFSTPLLDWTSSPFVAAYFAFINHGARQTKNRAIYALHRPTIEKQVQKIVENAENVRMHKITSTEKVINHLAHMASQKETAPQVEFIRPMSDENQRLVNQGGLFTRAYSGKSLDSWVKANPTEGDGLTLIKIFIPNKEREKCLQTLNRMNINHLTLFPDLYGASKFCNLFGEIEKY